jgi:hypothetical protein
VTITNRQATEVARKYGLTLTDAAALSRLADSIEEGEELAKTFTTPPTPPQLTREDLGKMSPAQVNEARENHQLDDLLNAGAQ